MQYSLSCVSVILCRPQSLESMKSVEGVSDVWLQRYGEKFLKSIGSYCQTREEDVPMDAHLSAPSQPAVPKQIAVKVVMPIASL